ncbi:hypothetical protein DSO57_1008660 [Entomophthora muscae]|uniref:Uncharacterized protein n=2 Tax=Entomophthora muscae TaxID=34485 RepID=A0ACC2SJW3_9FUNG|nr:hypothetical protein DSO57_1008657 [Entomophthora muscae]KAJ9062637.1 hypothetical protein DSO57_1008660 [Entomophthora muscae]
MSRMASIKQNQRKNYAEYQPSPGKRHVIAWDSTPPALKSQELPQAISPDRTFNILQRYADELTFKEALIFHDALKTKATPALIIIQESLPLVVASFDKPTFKFLLKAVIARHLFSSILQTGFAVDMASQQMAEAINYYSSAISAQPIYNHGIIIPSLLDDLLDLTNCILGNFHT